MNRSRSTARTIGKSSVGVPAIVAMLVMLSARASAQHPNLLDLSAIQPGEQLWITTDTVHTGTLTRADADTILLATSQGELSIRTVDVLRIHRRTNGIRLGTLIGAGAAVPVAVVLGTHATNEGGSAALIGLLSLAIGAGAGAAVDGILGTRRLVYERPGLTAVPDRVSGGARWFVTGGFGVARDAFISTSIQQVATGALFRTAGSRLWTGVQVDLPIKGVDVYQIDVDETPDFGPLVSVDLGSRGSVVRPFLGAAYLIGDAQRSWQLGGGVDVRLVEKLSLRIGARDVLHRYEPLIHDQRTGTVTRFPPSTLQRVSLDFGVIVR
jgi:hypothetical protein